MFVQWVGRTLGVGMVERECFWFAVEVGNSVLFSHFPIKVKRSIVSLEIADHSVVLSLCDYCFRAGAIQVPL